MWKDTTQVSRNKQCDPNVECYWSIGVLDRSHFSVCVYKVSQGFLCGRKQAALALLSFVRASTVDSHTQTKGSNYNYLAITVCCIHIYPYVHVTIPHAGFVLVAIVLVRVVNSLQNYD